MRKKILRQYLPEGQRRMLEYCEAVEAGKTPDPETLRYFAGRFRETLETPGEYPEQGYITKGMLGLAPTQLSHSIRSKKASQKKSVMPIKSLDTSKKVIHMAEFEIRRVNRQLGDLEELHARVRTKLRRADGSYIQGYGRPSQGALDYVETEIAEAEERLRELIEEDDE